MALGSRRSMAEYTDSLLSSLVEASILDDARRRKVPAVPLYRQLCHSIASCASGTRSQLRRSRLGPRRAAASVPAVPLYRRRPPKPTSAPRSPPRSCEFTPVKGEFTPAKGLFTVSHPSKVDSQFHHTRQRSIHKFITPVKGRFTGSHPAKVDSHSSKVGSHSPKVDSQFRTRQRSIHSFTPVEGRFTLVKGRFTVSHPSKVNSHPSKVDSAARRHAARDLLPFPSSHVVYSPSLHAIGSRARYIPPPYTSLVPDPGTFPLPTRHWSLISPAEGLGDSGRQQHADATALAEVPQHRLLHGEALMFLHDLALEEVLRTTGQTVQYSAVGTDSTVQYNTVQYGTVQLFINAPSKKCCGQYGTVQSGQTGQYRTVRYGIALHQHALEEVLRTVRTVQYGTALHQRALKDSTIRIDSTGQDSTVRYSNAPSKKCCGQYGTVQSGQYSTIQYNTVQYNTVPYSTVRYSSSSTHPQRSGADSTVQTGQDVTVLSKKRAGARASRTKPKPRVESDKT
eukprot:466190-Prorocentrum_minimum.AAC.1